MPSPRIRLATPPDADRIKTIAVDAGMFTPVEVEFFNELLAGFADGSLEGHQWLVATDDEGEICGAANYAPEPFSDRMWNLYFIAIDPCQQHEGFGTSLLKHIEYELTAMGPQHARVLIIDTSSTEQYVVARQFYTKWGYVEECRLRQFYGPDDDKVTFWKSLV